METSIDAVLPTLTEADAVAALAALAQNMRLRIFRALVGAAPQGLTPGALSATLDVPASTLSFHLKELVHAGLVTVEQEGRFLRYRANLAQMQAMVAFLTAECCGGEPGHCAGVSVTCTSTSP